MEYWRNSRDSTASVSASNLQLFRLFMLISILAVIPGNLRCQDRTVSQPSPQSSRTSPNGEYEWVVNETAPVSYQLLDLRRHAVCATIKSYFADSDSRLAIGYASRVNTYWNTDSNMVALDELNYRRAGCLYFFSVGHGNSKQIEVRVPAPPDFDEARLCADKAWISPSRFSVRQAIKLKTGGFQSKYYIIDLESRTSPTWRPIARIR